MDPNWIRKGLDSQTVLPSLLVPRGGDGSERNLILEWFLPTPSVLTLKTVFTILVHILKELLAASFDFHFHQDLLDFQ